MLPWVQVKGLASKILRTQRPANAARLGDPLWVSSPAAGNASGSVSFSWYMRYRAANWDLVIGRTAGRGRVWTRASTKLMVRRSKDIYVYPLVPDARQQLSGNLRR